LFGAAMGYVGAIHPRLNSSEIRMQTRSAGFPGTIPACRGPSQGPAVLTKVPVAKKRSERNLDDIPAVGNPFFEPPDDIVNAGTGR
jgi:hypothetical protein